MSKNLKILTFICLQLCCLSLFSASLFLINDSKWQLTALIEAADGTKLDTVVLEKGKKIRWNTELYNSKAKVPQVTTYSLTPFTVTWLCPNKGTYSVCTAISSGATVSAHSGFGNFRCTTEEELREQRENIEKGLEEQEKSLKKELKCPPCPSQEKGENVEKQQSNN